jgi:hypothetical protein
VQAESSRKVGQAGAITQRAAVEPAVTYDRLSIVLHWLTAGQRGDTLFNLSVLRRMLP